MPVDPDTVVQFAGVRKAYRLGETWVQALRGVDLSISRGSFVAVAGPSGSGKTTLLNLVGCLDVPTEGEVYVHGQAVSRLSDDAATRLRRDAIGFIFQTFNLVPVFDVYENVEFPLILKGWTGKARDRKVRDTVEAVGLTSHQAHRPDQLSGGQRQRVAIARALVTDPLLVLADEPTANLDSETGDGIVRLMRDINRERNVTFVFATHDARVVELATRIVRLRDGVVESGGGVGALAGREVAGLAATP
jgi:putative ABC transport system ATP-binding protein